MGDKDLLQDKWVPVKTVDPMKRKPAEWARIYNIKLLHHVEGIWSEYEWAYNLQSLQYYPLPDKNSKGEDLDTFEKAAQMELRAFELSRDIFMGADLGEKHILESKGKYIETGWVRRRLNLI